jgi:hypothetical protein
VWALHAVLALCKALYSVMLTHLKVVFPNDCIDERGLHKYADTVRKKIAVHAAAVRTAASQQLDMPNVASRFRARQRLVRGDAARFWKAIVQAPSV